MACNAPTLLRSLLGIESKPRLDQAFPFAFAPPGHIAVLLRISGSCVVRGIELVGRIELVHEARRRGVLTPVLPGVLA